MRKAYSKQWKSWFHHQSHTASQIFQANTPTSDLLIYHLEQNLTRIYKSS